MVLTGEMDFSRCKRFSIRGYDQVRLTSTVSTEIKDCKAFNPILINPNIVIDAVGAASATGQFIICGKQKFLAYFKAVLSDIHLIILTELVLRIYLYSSNSTFSSGKTNCDKNNLLDRLSSTSNFLIF